MRHGLLAALLGVGLGGCGRTPVRNYYTLTYEAPAKRFERPTDLVLRVRPVRVRESYRRAELVHRYDVHEMRYYRSRRWSAPPEKMLTTLLTDHVRATGVVRQVTNAMGQVPPEYTLEADLEAMEEQIAGPNRYARMAMALQLVRSADDSIVWRYHFDERLPVGGSSARGTVRAVSRIFSREVDRAVDDLGRFLKDPGGYFPDREAALDKAEAVVDDGLVRPDTDSSLLDLPQVLKDDTPMPVGFGAIFLPTTSNGDREPVVAVYPDGSDEAVVEGQMGKRIVLEPGIYEVKFGSGAGTQQLERRVEVAPGHTTVLRPEWGGLDIDVLDESFVPFRGSYELFRMANQDNYGLGLGADALSGEAVRVWVVPPGLYKIVRAGGSYAARTDFATVRISPGELRKLTLVLDEDTGEFKGAGEVASARTTGVDSPWSGNAAIDGNIVFNSTEEAGQTEAGEKLALGLRLFGSLRYQDDTNLWDTRADIEETQEQPASKKKGDSFIEGLESEEDRLFVHTIYTYLVVPWFGPYVQMRSETSLLPKYIGDPGDRTRFADSFAPWNLREGAGGNFRVVRRRDIELDVRAGFGARQFLARGTLKVEEGQLVTEANSDTPVELENDIVEGLEAAVVLLGRVTRWVTLSAEFDGLFPFDELQQPRFEWRNQVSLRLASFVSLAYRFNVESDPNLELDDDLQKEHDIQLRFSYVLF